MSRWEDDETFLSRWLNNEVSPEEKAAFEASAEGKEYIAMLKAAEQFRAPDYNVNSELERLKGTIAALPKPETKVIWMQPVFRYAVAAAVVLVAVVAFLLQPNLTKISTGFGEQEIAFLPDGSEVRLNSNSSIAYDPDTWEESRTVKLSGEAFFQVKKGSDFVVGTSGGDVKVLGTSFNVKIRNGNLEVICYTGKVNVSSTEVDHDLTPGMAVRVEGGVIQRAWTKNLDKSPSWINGLTNLEDVPFQEALDELRNVFGVNIDYNNDLDSLIFNGAFPNNNVESAIQLVLDPLNIRYSYDSNSGNLVIEGLKR